jgi:hypothetical protein
LDRIDILHARISCGAKKTWTRIHADLPGITRITAQEAAIAWEKQRRSPDGA